MRLPAHRCIAHSQRAVLEQPTVALAVISHLGLRDRVRFSLISRDPRFQEAIAEVVREASAAIALNDFMYPSRSARPLGSFSKRTDKLIALLRRHGRAFDNSAPMYLMMRCFALHWAYGRRSRSISAFKSACLDGATATNQCKSIDAPGWHISVRKACHLPRGCYDHLVVRHRADPLNETLFELTMLDNSAFYCKRSAPGASSTITVLVVQ